MMENRLQDLDNRALIVYLNRVIDKYNETKLERTLVMPTAKLYKDYTERLEGCSRLFSKAFAVAQERGIYVVH